MVHSSSLNIKDKKQVDFKHRFGKCFCPHTENTACTTAPARIPVQD